MWSHPHGISCEGVQGQGPQVCEEHLKDEEGFFAWAELYLEGKYALPVSDAGGVYISTSVTNPNPLAENYDLSATMAMMQPGQQQPPNTQEQQNGTSGRQQNPPNQGNNGGQQVTLLLSRSVDDSPVVGAEIWQFLQNGENLLGQLDNSGSWSGTVRQQDGMVMVLVEDDGEDVWLLANIEPERRRTDVGIYASIDEQITEVLNLSNSTIFLRVPPPSEGSTPLQLALWWDNPAITDDEWLVDEAGTGGMIHIPSNLTWPAQFRIKTVSGAPFENGRIVWNSTIIGVSGEDGLLEITPPSMLETQISVTIPDGFEVDQLRIAIDKPSKPHQEHREINWVVESDSTTYHATLGSSWDVQTESPTKITAIWENPNGTAVPMASGLTVHNGELVWANHWAPGPSLAIALLLLVGLESLYGILVLLSLVIPLHYVAERMIGRGSGRIVSSLTILTGGVAMLVHGQWMGDLSTVSLLCAGLALALVTLDKQRSEGTQSEGSLTSPTTWLIGLSAGLLLGGAVWMRYSSVIVLPCLLLTLFALERKSEANEEQHRSWISVLKAKRTWAVATPVIIGALILGVALGAYNSEWYGGPFNSGYQSNQLLAFEDDGNVSAAEPSESFLGQYLGHMDRDPITYLGAFLLVSLVHLPTIFAPLVAFLAVGPRESKKRLVKRPGVLLLSATWFICILATYSTQLWVLNNTITDIRYYLPLLPPAALLSAAILMPVKKEEDLDIEQLLWGTENVSEESSELPTMLDLEAEKTGQKQLETYPIGWLVLPLVGLCIGLIQRTRLEVSQFSIIPAGSDMWRPWPDRLPFHPSEVTTIWFSVGVLLIIGLSIFAYNRRLRLMLD